VTGDLTIAGTTHPITLEVEVASAFDDVMGFHRIGIGASAILHRADWGLTWNMALEAGRVLVGDDVRIEIDGAFVHKPEPVEAALAPGS
jgi:polyisoprenoid-binding protein YceI